MKNKQYNIEKTQHKNNINHTFKRNIANKEQKKQKFIPAKEPGEKK